MSPLLYSILVVSVIGVWGELQLRQVNLIYRHGDRAPVVIYPKDNNKIDKWPFGVGQLTRRGIQQQMELGSWLRRRYGELVGPELYTPDIYVRSSDFPRTLMSASANLAGFVRNDSFHVMKSLPWRPVAISSVPLANDYLLFYNVCSRYIKEKESLYESEPIKTKLSSYLPLLKTIQTESGFSTIQFINTWIVHDAVLCEKSHNMTINKWVTDDIWKKMKELEAINWEIMFSKDLSKLMGGYLLHTITNNMKKVPLKINNRKHHKKIIMYSGHDNNLAAMSKLLKFPELMQPVYASVIIIELYSNSNNSESWFVKVMYKNNRNYQNTEDVVTHQIPGCQSSLCPWDQFIKVTEDKSMSFEECTKACATTSHGSETYSKLSIYIGLGVIGVVIGIIFLLVLVHHRHQLKKYRSYSRLG